MFSFTWRAIPVYYLLCIHNNARQSNLEGRGDGNMRKAGSLTNTGSQGIHNHHHDHHNLHHHHLYPQMQKITMRFEEPPVLEKQPEKEQIALQRQQMAAAGE